MSVVFAFVVGRVSAFLNEEVQLPLEVQIPFRSLQTGLCRMLAVLDDQTQKEDDEVPMGWMEEAIKVCYDAEDVLDNFIFRRRRKNSGFIGLVKRKIVSGVISPDKVLKEMKQIERKMEDFGRRVRMDNNPIGQYMMYTLSCESRWSSSMLEEPELVGMKEDMHTLRERLLSGEPRPCVISIVGMGGSGKTTLAQKIYNDVKKNFDYCAWVCVSQHFVIKEHLTRIIECLMITSKEKIENLNEEELGMMLRDHLREKRYLLVIDDVWSIEAWDALKHALPPYGMNKSRVVLTTRHMDVAVHADTAGGPLVMHPLTADEGWEFFMNKIFPGRNECPPELEQIGREILAGCEGLPLAISIVAGLLSKDMTLRTWSKVLEAMISPIRAEQTNVENPIRAEQPNVENPIRAEQPNVENPVSAEQLNAEKILALSYRGLPSFLKPCFLYFGLFPKDYEISSGRLIRLWIAEGFIEQTDNAILEDVAEDYLKQLVERSMIEVTSRRSNGSVGKCRIRVILRDLCISEARKNNFFTIHNDTETSPSSALVRRFAIYGSFNGHETGNRSIASLRSILCFPGSKCHLSNLCNTSGKLLRVLHVHHEEYSRETVPEDVGKFLLLRYLEFIFCTRESLPSSIGKLVGLQTLKLTHHGTLPNTIWNLEQLRYLNAYRFDIEGDSKLIKKLSNLQTLCLRAGCWIGDGLEELTNLRKLGIFGDLSSYHMKLSHSILKLRKLRSLKLRLGSSIPPFKPFTFHDHLYKMFLEGKIEKLIEFPPNLNELTLSKSGLEQAAISALEKHPHLKILKLWCNAYRSEKMNCSSGGFPSLQILELCELPLEEWIAAEGAMPSLKSVKLIDMSHLKTPPKQICDLLKQNWLKEGEKQSINGIGRRSGDISMPHASTSALASNDQRRPIIGFFVPFSSSYHFK